VRSVVLIGNPRPNSRTAVVAVRFAAHLHRALTRAGIAIEPPSVVDLAPLARHLFAGGSDEVAGALGAVCDSGLLTVASPTFKASYTGLLKSFLDLVPMRALDGTVSVPVMTAASGCHRYAVETYLRPLLMELGAVVPVPGLSLLEAEFGSVDDVFARWARSAVPPLVASVRPQTTPATNGGIPAKDLIVGTDAGGTPARTRATPW
jgi:FMN reductase